MKLIEAKVHNYRSVIDAELQIDDYILLVGANNSGKSNIVNAIRAFYDDHKWTSADFPKVGAVDAESWVELTFLLNDLEWAGLAEKYKDSAQTHQLKTRRYFKSDKKDRVKANQSNIYGYAQGQIEEAMFYGAKNVSEAKLGQVLYIPALTTPADQTKLSGPSPLRDMINFLLKKIVTKSPAYAAIADSFRALNNEARGKDGFLHDLAEPLNAAIAQWDVKIDLSVNALGPEEISKGLISFAFLDPAHGDAGLQLDRFGHGFQRSVIYELIRLAPTFKESKQKLAKDFNPDLTLVLFEEPEAFLHPAQQENMAYHLRRLAKEEGQQILLTTHSSLFAGKAIDHIPQLIRVSRTQGMTTCYQPNSASVAEIFEQGGQLLKVLQEFVANPAIPDSHKQTARKTIANPPQDDIAVAEERFRYQLWLDAERSSIFFADKVLLVEGASEKALFTFLLSDEWHDLQHKRVYIVDVMGKFNMHRYMSFLTTFGIPYGIIIDDDDEKHHHQAVNEMICVLAKLPIIAPPQKIDRCIEKFLGLHQVKEPRPDRKPLELIKALSNGEIDSSRIAALKDVYKAALGI